MPLPTFTVTVTKMTRRAPHVVELRLASVSGAEPLDLWPELALRVLADPEGSPLAGQPLYDDTWGEEHASRYIGDVALLKCRSGELRLSRAEKIIAAQKNSRRYSRASR